MAGSGLFSKRKAVAPHLVVSTGPGGGLAGEVADLRQDVAAELGKLGTITCEEFVNPPAAVTTAFKTAHATTVAAGKVFTVGSGLDGASAGLLLPFPRPVTITTAGGTAADALNTSVVFEGTDIYGRTLTETVLAAGTASTVTGNKCFKKVTKITEGASPGTGATIAYGFGAPIGLGLPIRTVQGLTGALREIAVGALVTNGTFVAAATALPNGSYSPNSAPDGTRDYAIYYDFDATVVTPLDVKAELEPPERIELSRRRCWSWELRGRGPSSPRGACGGGGCCPLFFTGSLRRPRVGEQEHGLIKEAKFFVRRRRPRLDESLK